jgi:hypothetical protein
LSRESVPVYGWGGFTTMTDGELEQQVGGWLVAGCTEMKIKVGESGGRTSGVISPGPRSCGSWPARTCR